MAISKVVIILPKPGPTSSKVDEILLETHPFDSAVCTNIKTVCKDGHGTRGKKRRRRRRMRRESIQRSMARHNGTMVRSIGWWRWQ